MARSRGPYEEHQFSRLIPGDVETVRNRICVVLEESNYVVLSESPIQAKRNQSRSILTATILEIMRMTAGASASQQEIIFGLLVTLLTLAVSLPMVLGSDGKAANIGWVFLVIGGLLAFLSLQQGLRRLQRTLNPKSGTPHSQKADSPRTAFEPQRIALPPRPDSVTEGTTDLIADPIREAVPAHVIKDTDPIT